MQIHFLLILYSSSIIYVTTHAGSNIFINVTEGSIRLVGGSGPHEGRVEINFLGHWGTVCNRQWDVNDTAVVCRQQGYLSVVDVPEVSKFGRGTGIIWLDVVGCNGSEANLRQCTNRGLGVHSCSHNSDAAVICSSKYL